MKNDEIIIDEMFNLLREDWMDDKEFENYKELILEESGMTYEQMCVDIKIGVETWMDRKEYGKISDFNGILSQENSTHPEAYERSQYIKAVVGIS